MSARHIIFKDKSLDEIKKFNNYNAYRTFIGEKMTAIKLINYDWAGNAGQLGLKNEDLLQDTDT